MRVDRLRVLITSFFLIIASALAGSFAYLAAGENATSQTFFQGATLIWILGFLFYWSNVLLSTPITRGNQQQWIHIAKLNGLIVGAIAVFMLFSLVIVNLVAASVLPAIAAGVFLVILLVASVWFLLWVFTILHQEISSLELET